MRGIWIAFLLCTAPAWAESMFGPSRELRSINADLYEISVQKNGRTDVVLTSRDKVFDNAFPMVWFEGADEPQPLAIDGRLTERDPVSGPLGQGQGMFFKKGPCEWTIGTYPTQPFITAKVAYVNSGKKPVKVKALIPWAVGAPRKGGISLGPGTANTQVIENGRAIADNGELPSIHPISTDSPPSAWNVALVNRSGQRCLVAGCLSTDRTFTQFRIATPAGQELIETFRAECVYDPPVEVLPGERLESETLYLAVAETDPFAGLERYAHTFALANQIKKPTSQGPHGWDSWNTKAKDQISQDGIMAALDFMDTHLKRYGWDHFAIDDGWQKARGDWEPNERFPNGMKWLADQIHARDMKAGLWIAPFVVSTNAPLAKEHPQWLVEPNAAKRDSFRADERILDVTAPGAYEYVRDLCKGMAETWGYDTLHEADFVYQLLAADHYADAKLTRIEVLNKGLAAIREGFGPNGITGFAPLPVSARYVSTMRIGDDCAPIWRKAPEQWPWGAVEAARNSARRYYFAQDVWRPALDCAYFAHKETRERWGVSERPPLSRDNSLAWLTAQALAGGTVQIGDWLPDLAPDEIGALSRLLPTLGRPARPVDLLDSDTPAIWSVNLKAPAGQWSIVGVFNWDETKPAAIPLNLAGLGLDPGARYTVYDFWQDAFYGLAQGSFKVNLAPGSVHLLGLRRYEEHPMFVATDRHFSQGASDHTALGWEPSQRVLSGTFDGIADTDYNLRVFVPEGFAVGKVSVSTGEPATQQEGRLLKIGFHCEKQGPVSWSVAF